MNIKELSIGNWVEFQNSYYKIRNLYVNGAIQLEDKNGIGLSLTSDYILNEIKPIPLTNEILEKNFVKNDAYERGWYIFDEISIYASRETNDGWIYQVQCCEAIDIRYVHQLQNLLMLLNSHIIIQL